MIARIWSGWTTADNADAYEALLKTEIFPAIRSRQIAGFIESEKGESSMCKKHLLSLLAVLFGLSFANVYRQATSASTAQTKTAQMRTVKDQVLVSTEITCAAASAVLLSLFRNRSLCHTTGGCEGRDEPGRVAKSGQLAPPLL